MKRLLVLCIALLAVSAPRAHAVNINGAWKGAGKITDNKGANIPCESMEVDVVQTAAVLNVSTTFTCNGERASSPGGNLDIKGSDLFEKGVKVGTISANSVTLSVKDSQHSLDTQCNFTANEMTFHTVTTYANDPGHVVTFDGKVTR